MVHETVHYLSQTVDHPRVCIRRKELEQKFNCNFDFRGEKIIFEKK